MRQLCRKIVDGESSEESLGAARRGLTADDADDADVRSAACGPREQVRVEQANSGAWGAARRGFCHRGHRGHGDFYFKFRRFATGVNRGGRRVTQGF